MYCGDSSFPVRKLIPKEEINSAIFLRQNPQFDGRGIVVAVLDTGVDPAAPGLQVTSDGKPKLLDIIDTTGSGDVDTSKVVTLSETEDYLFLLSGRKIKIPPHWKSYNKIFFLGIKRAFELYPEDLVKRLKDEHQKKWDRFRYQAKAKVVGKISFCKKKQKEADNDSDQTAKTLEDYKARKIVLENYESKTYHGPVLDCIVFHDGKEWLACALLEDEDPFTAKVLAVMADYKIRQEYSTFSNQDMLSYSFNIYNEGSRLSISVCCGSHGTHVAGILAAYHPDNSGVNGIAPGAQIVSVKIGDTRLGGMETGISVIRGLSAVLKNKCDLINMSFGEDVHMADVGLFSALANAVVRKHGVVFVSSAGNQGPALSTVSAPGGTTYSLISVGAFVSKSMMDVDHSMRECVNEGYYTWSSRGPAYNGDFGVTIGAPGCAIASVPAFTLKGGQLMNGTSMASPNACGGIALLLSALKNNSVEYTPERIRRAVVNTAQLMSNMDAFTQGYGLLNVLGAYDHAVKYRDYRGHDVSYEIRTSCGHEARGIYIREPWQMAVEKEVTVSVRPVFPENTENIEKINYKVLFVLDCEAAWIKLPRHFALMNEERSFKVLLKASSASLPPGPHFTVIKGFDSAATEVGPLFCISVTLLVPVPLSAHRHQFEVDFYPGYISRHFYQVPDGSRWAEICLVTTIQAGGTRQFAIQVQQLEAMKGHTHSGFKTHIVASDKSPWVRVIPVLPGFTLEFCLAQYWASLGNCRVKCTVHFHGVETEGSVFKIPSDVAAFRVSYTCRLGPETIKPSGTFKAVETRMAPTSYSLSPSSHPLDALPDDRCMYALCLEYPPFSVDKKDDLTPRVTSLNGRLYDSVFAAQLLAICDKFNRVLYWTDCYTQKLTLHKGEYTVRVCVMAESLALLETMTGTILVLERKLSEPLNFSFFPTYNDAILRKNEWKRTLLHKNERGVIFIAPPPINKLTLFKNGDVLVGKLHLCELPSNKSLGTIHFVVLYEVPPSAKPGKSEKTKLKDDEQNYEKLKEEILNKQIAALEKLKKDEAFRLFSKLERKHGDYLPLHAAYLRNIDGISLKRVLLPAVSSLSAGSVLETHVLSLELDREGARREPERLKEVLNICDKIIEKVDQSGLAAFYGIKQPVDNSESRRLKKEKDETEAIFVEALIRKAYALLEFEDLGCEVRSTVERREELMKLLNQWCSAKSPQHEASQLLNAEVELRRGQYGLAMKTMDGIYQELTDRDLRAKATAWKVCTLHRAGWLHCSHVEAGMYYAQFPATVPLMY